MNIGYGNGTTEYGPGVAINLTGDEVALAVLAWLVAHGVHVDGPRTVTVNGELCEGGCVYVDPEGFVITPNGRKLAGRDGDERNLPKRPSDPPPTARVCAACNRVKDDAGETYGWGLCQCGSFRHPTATSL